MESGITHLIDLWKEGYSDRLDSHNPFQAMDQLKHIASLFSPGEFYYFVLNMHNLELEYVHPNVTKFMDVDPQHTTIAELLKSVVPEDIQSVKHKEIVLKDFLEKFEHPDQLPFYKILYMYRVKDRYGKFRTMLLQVNVLSVSKTGTIEHVLSVHTDISYMGVAKNDYISFISLNGEKSFYNVDSTSGMFDPDCLENPVELIGESLTRREREIIFHFSKGAGIKDVARILTISEFTVRTHKKNILKKTHHTNLNQLISQCVMEGLI